MSYYYRASSVEECATIHSTSCEIAPPLADLPGFPTIEAARQAALSRPEIPCVKVCPLCLAHAVLSQTE